MLKRGSLCVPSSLDSRYVVDSVLALFDDALNLREPDLSTVVFFPRRARHKAQISDRKDDRIEHGFVPLVEGTIYENVIARINHAVATGPRLTGHG